MSILHTRFVLAVPDVESAAHYWVNVLGFDLQLTIPGWRFVARGPCQVMLGECPEALSPAALGDHSYFGYLVVDDLDASHAEIKAKGALINAAPTDKDWGMREMAVATPDGHRMMFGQEINQDGSHEIN